MLYHAVEGPVADDGASAFPAILLWLAGGVLWEVAVAGRSAAGTGPGPAPAMAPFPVLYTAVHTPA